MKTYLTIIFSSEGANPVEVVERLRTIGFKPLKGAHDHVYDWGRKLSLKTFYKLHVQFMKP